MKKAFFLIFIITQLSYSQQVQWASKLIKYSSDLGGKQYGIKRILGKPDAFPQTGESPNAWTPKNALDGREIVIVGFDKPQIVKQVAVFENINAGNVVRIMVSTDGEKFETAWSRKPNYKTPVYKTSLNVDRSYYFGKRKRKVYEIPSVFNPGIENAVFDKSFSNIIAVKVEFNFAILPGQKQIDAIGISDSEKPIDAEINVNSKFENLSNAAKIDIGDFNFSAITISNDGKKLFFTSDEESYQKIYVSIKEGNTWSKPEKNEKLSDNNSFNYIETVSSNFILKGGNSYAKATKETGYTFYNSNTFEKDSPLLISAFSNYGDYSDASITNDKQFLILAIESDFSQGGNDLYVSKLKEDGTFGVLQNLGKVINSASDEITPQLLSDTKTMIFASDGFSDYGNYDIFVSYRLDDSWKNWSEPINLGSKINSSSYEGSPFYDEINEMLYFITIENDKTIVKSISIKKDELIKN